MKIGDKGNLTLQKVAAHVATMEEDILSRKAKNKNWCNASDKVCLRFLKKCYTEGRCGEWAYVLNKKTSWPIMRIARPKDNQHYYCETPEGFVVDAEGISTLELLKKRFKLRTDPMIEEIDPAELQPSDEERVVQYASLVMDRMSFLQEVHGTVRSKPRAYSRMRRVEVMPWRC